MIDDEQGQTAGGSPGFEESYELGRRIGSGGSSEVYEAVQRALDRRVAIKLLSPGALQDTEWRARFESEAQICAGLAHPNVLVVLDHGVTEGRPFLVTELIEGRPLSVLMGDKARLTAGAVFRIIEQVLDGLEAVHALGVVHRDLKPENIVIGDTEDLPVKITDFGVAKKVGSAFGPSTAQGVVLGTPAYMSPEQIAGQAPGPASDLYALAVIVYEMVVGEHPFPAQNTREMLRAQLLSEPRIPWSLHPGLREILERGLAKSPSERFASAAEFRRSWRRLEADILGRAGVVTYQSGPVVIPGAPGVVRASGALCVTRLSGANERPRLSGSITTPGAARDTGTTRALASARSLVIVIGLACAMMLALVLPALLWMRP